MILPKNPLQMHLSAFLKIAVQKTVEATSDLIFNKIADAVAKSYDG